MKHLVKFLFKVVAILIYPFAAAPIIIIAIWFWDKKYLEIITKLNDEILNE